MIISFFPAGAIVEHALTEWTLFELHVACVRVYDGIMKLQKQTNLEEKITHEKKKRRKLERRWVNSMLERVLCVEFCCEQTGIETKTDEQNRHFPSLRMDFRV